jgi:hypothetical protein
VNPKIFLSHTSSDKPFVRRLAQDLEAQGVYCWLDEAEIKIGESLIEKIRSGIDKVDFVAVILSQKSVEAPWVRREVDVAMNQEIAGRSVKVLPVMLSHCELPGFLLGKLYADFTEEALYEAELKKLISSVGLVFNRLAFLNSKGGTTIGAAIEKAWDKSLPTLSRPFHRPFQYMGLSVQDAARAVNGTPNGVGNIIIETDDCHMLLEAEGNFINYVEIDLKQTAPHNQDQEFDSEVLLGALSINPSELEFVRKKTHVHTYYDHRRKLKVNISCLYDGAPLTISFSSKYYGM